MDEEWQLIADAKKESRAFEPLYNRYFESIFRFIHQRLDSLDTARDLTQQTFIKALGSIQKYENRGVPFKSWLYRIALNELNAYFRQNKGGRCLNIDDEDILELRDELEEDPYRDFYPRLSEQLMQLDAESLNLVEMRFFERRSFREIGEILGISENNAKVRMYRLLEKLKDRLTAKTKTGNKS